MMRARAENRDVSLETEISDKTMKKVDTLEKAAEAIDVEGIAAKAEVLGSKVVAALIVIVGVLGEKMLQSLIIYFLTRISLHCEIEVLNFI